MGMRRAPAATAPTITTDARSGARPGALVGDGLPVPCADGQDRPYVSLDAAASTSALPAVVRAVDELLPWYSSVHRGAGQKSQHSTSAYEAARAAALRFAGRPVDGDDVAIICRNTTEAINHLAYRLRLAADDIVVTTVVEHHANLLPWARSCRRRHVECGRDGTFTLDDVTAVLDDGPRARLLAVTAASNVTGWRPPLDGIIAAAHARGVPVLVDAAQVAAHRPLPAAADFLAWSGHKMYAPFGAGVLIGPGRRSPRATRSLPGAVRSTWSTSTRSRGPTRPSARRPARPTWSALWRCTLRSTSSAASVGTPSPRTTPRFTGGCAPAWPRYPAWPCWGQRRATARSCPS